MAGTEVKFANRLGSNEPTVRNRAIKALRKWISARSASSQKLSELELLKLWKGLFVCMWHSDKPLVQEELAGSIASLVHNFNPPDAGVEYIKVFFLTIAREWHNIDRLRLDKFYMLIRRVVSSSFRILKDNSWEEGGLVQMMVSLYQEGPLNPTLENTCVGVQLHVTEVYLTELGQLLDDDFPVTGLMDLLEPFFLLYSRTKNSTIAETVEKNVFSVLMGEKQSDVFKIDKENLKQTLVQWAANRDTSGKARKCFYALKKRLEDQDCGENVQVKRRRLQH
ncbi:hypothetical protein EMCRGX_G034377 [Ephydatia muelleri]|eukprot:Em0023g312a